MGLFNPMTMKERRKLSAEIRRHLSVLIIIVILLVFWGPIWKTMVRAADWGGHRYTEYMKAHLLTPPAGGGSSKR